MLYVARNKDGSLNLFDDEPYRCDTIGLQYPGDKVYSIPPCCWRTKNPYGGFNISGFIHIDDKLFPELKWEDDPITVDLMNASI